MLSRGHYHWQHEPCWYAVKKGGSGAAAGKPDTDNEFLKAIASTKRGKKTEDVFDREFNKLKISKPEVEKRDPEEEWAVLAEFGDDSGLRGNFMTVVEMDVFRRDGRGQAREPLREWDGKPNYKKFKKVCDVWVFVAGLVLMRFFFVETDEPGARCEGGGVCLRRKRLWHGLWCEQAFFHCGIVEANSCFSVLERRVTRTFADAECDLQ